MRAAGLWARAELRRSWRSLLVLAVLAGVAGGVVVATVAGALRAGASIDRFEAATETSHVTLFTDAPLGGAVREALDDDPRVAERSTVAVTAIAPEGLVPGLEAVAVAGRELPGLQFRPRTLDGRLPEPGESDAAAVSELTARQLGYEVGDEVEMRYFDPETAEVCREGDANACRSLRSAGRVRVVGIVRTTTDLAVNAFQQHIFFVDRELLVGLDDPLVIGHIESVRLHRADDAAEVAADYSVQVGEAGDALSATGDLDGPRRAAGLQRTALLIGAALAGLAVAVAVGQAYGRHLSRASDQVDTLDALGLRWRDRTGAATISALGVAVVGAVVSLATAVVLSPIFPFGLARRADPPRGLTFDAGVVGVATVGVVAVLVAATLVAAAIWARAPRSARRRVGRQSSVGELAVVSNLSPPQATGARFALVRGPAGRRLPVISTLAAAATAIAIVAGLLVVAVSLDGLLARSERYGAPWDVAVPLDMEDPLGDAARLASDPRVDAAAAIASGELTVEARRGEPVQLPAVAYEHVAGRLDPVVLEGRSPAAPDEIALATATYRELDVFLGDRVQLFGPGGTRQVRVVGRLILPAVGNTDVQRGMVVALDTFDELGAAELLADVDVEASVLVQLTDDASATEYAADLRNGSPARLVDVPSQQVEVRALREVELIPLLLGGFTAAIAVVAVAHALAVAGRRRSGDLAVLRALGLRPAQAGEVVRWQGITIGAAALALGIPFGLVLGRLVWSTIAGWVSVPVVIDLPALPLLAVVAGTIGVMAVVAIPPGRRVAQLRPAELLRAE